MQFHDHCSNTPAALKKKEAKIVNAAEQDIMPPQGPLGDDDKAPIRSSVHAKNVEAGLVKHQFTKEDLKGATALATGTSDVLVTQISAKKKKKKCPEDGGRKPRTFLDDTISNLNLSSTSMQQEDEGFGQLLDLLKPADNQPEKDSKVVIRLMRAGSDKSLELLFQKSSDRKMENIIQEASRQSCDFFNFSVVEHQAVKNKKGSMILNVDGVSDYSYSLFKLFGLNELVVIASGNTNDDGHTVVEITSRIEMMGADVSHLFG